MLIVYVTLFLPVAATPVDPVLLAMPQADLVPVFGVNVLTIASIIPLVSFSTIYPLSGPPELLPDTAL